MFNFEQQRPTKFSHQFVTEQILNVTVILLVHLTNTKALLRLSLTLEQFMFKMISPMQYDLDNLIF